MSSLCWRRCSGLRFSRTPFKPAYPAAATLARGSIAGALLADRADQRRIGVLLRLDEGQHVAKALVLGDRGVGHALMAGVEDTVGQWDALPADLERPVSKA